MMSRVEDSSSRGFIHVRSHWDYMRTKLKRRGVVEVDSSHPHHDMLNAVQMGIRELFTQHPEAHAKEELTNEDYTHKITINVTSPKNKISVYISECEGDIQLGQSYTFESYASPVFGCLRAAVDVNDDDFLENLSPNQVPRIPYLEFISNSRSGQDFYFSNNQRFILKTDHQHCVQFFISILRDYLDHFLTHPHSLLVKFLGLYSIKPAGGSTKYLLVMQSIFYPTMRLDDRFDIKGCLLNRYQNPNPSGLKTILVLKDQNFLQENIELGPQGDWFSKQLRADVDFLLSLGVQDYSLLLGRHPLHSMDKRESVSNLMVRIKKAGIGLSNPRMVDFVKELGKPRSSTNLPSSDWTTLSVPARGDRFSLSLPSSRSFGHDKSSIPVMPESDSPTPDGMDQTSDNNCNHTETKSEAAVTSPTHVDTEGAMEDPAENNHSCSKNKVSPSKGDHQNANTLPRAKIRRGKFLKSLSNQTYLDSTGLQFQNRRLLLNCENSLHVIDGVHHRYYVGIIDFFTQFRCRQRIGKFLKDLKTCGGNHSTEPPDKYGERFYEFLSEKIV